MIQLKFSPCTVSVPKLYLIFIRTLSLWFFFVVVDQQIFKIKERKVSSSIVFHNKQHLPSHRIFCSGTIPDPVVTTPSDICYKLCPISSPFWNLTHRSYDKKGSKELQYTCAQRLSKQVGNVLHIFLHSQEIEKRAKPTIESFFLCCYDKSSLSF